MSTTSYFFGGLKKVLLHTNVVTVPILLWPTVCLKCTEKLNVWKIKVIGAINQVLTNQVNE